MTVDDVKAKVQEIFDARHDDEVAHNREDALYEAVLEAIAQGASNPSELAEAALATRGLDFHRWCS